MCADSITHNYEWIKPQVGASPTTWGNKWNDNLDQIDAEMFTVATGVIGAITMYAGATAPPDWKFCDGTVYNNTNIPLLAPVLNNAFGGVSGISNAVPDFRGIFPIGMSSGAGGTMPVALGARGGEATHVLVTAEMPSHTHPLVDPGHFHTLPDEYVFGTDFFNAGTGAPFLTDTSSDTTTNTTGITMNATGGDGAHNNLPPFVGVNFIIKFQ